ncbi:MAG: L-aspartate oxidase [Planctomycetota bacterium]
MLSQVVFPRYLVDVRRLDSYEEVSADVVVIGGGVAGLSAAITAASACDTVVVTKKWVSDSNTEYAQGGIAAVLAQDDSIDSHFEDTMRVGQGLCDARVVWKVVSEGPSAVRRLIEWGGDFDRENGEIAVCKEGGHSSGRVIHAGDATGREIQRVMTEQARSLPRLRIFEHTFVLDLLHAPRGVVPACWPAPRNRSVLFRAKAVILCSGGAGQIYRETTNPDVATADGHALAFRAGATMRDMEFMQFHPTTLYIAGVARELVSETLRGEGGVLRDKHGHRFMFDYHPAGELAPRDTVSRAILDRMVKTKDTNVYLDLTHLPSAFVRERFPRINRICASFGIDITREMIPVHPSAHYMVGGMKTDIEGRSSLTGLYGAGEATSSGLHGANRLGSNSLLEGLVNGAVAARTAIRELPAEVASAIDPAGADLELDRSLRIDATDMYNSLKALMWRNVGIQRDGDNLREALRKLNTWMRVMFRVQADQISLWELTNMVNVSHLMARAALLREESRGVHYRTDFPESDDSRWRGHMEMRRDSEGSAEERFVQLVPEELVRPAAPEPVKPKIAASR